MLPFTRSQFLDVFVLYNRAIWPVQAVACAFGLLVLVAALARPGRLTGQVTLGALATMWIWTGIVYHWLFFSRINGAAFAFGLLFVIQGLVFGWMARKEIDFRVGNDAAGVGGVALIVYSLIGYPLIGLMDGPVTQMPAFGVTPCPLTVFTLGLLLLARPRLGFRIWAIPVAWSLIGGTASFLLGFTQDWILLAGPLAAWLAFQGRVRNHAMETAGNRG